MTAQHWHRAHDEVVQCELCPHACIIAPGKRGMCGVRENRAGTLVTLNYGVACSAHLDPIEKKPLYHFFPGSQIVSIGTYGCNLSCPWCQNYSISKEFSISALRPNLTPAALLAAVDEHARGGLRAMCGVAYTYNEPTVWFEFVMACAPLVRARGLKNVLVTNGFISPAPLQELLQYVDALNIDLKAFDDDFYRRHCHARLAPVLQTIRAAVQHAHVELTTLIIPTLNDAPEQFVAMREWIIDTIGADVPVHLSRYTPMYQCSLPPTPHATLERAAHILREKLHFVYLGNIGDAQKTICVQCGACLIVRHGYTTELPSLTSDSRCAQCGAAAPIVMK